MIRILLIGITIIALFLAVDYALWIYQEGESIKYLILVSIISIIILIISLVICFTFGARTYQTICLSIIVACSTFCVGAIKVYYLD